MDEIVKIEDIMRKLMGGIQKNFERFEGVFSEIKDLI